MVNYFLDILFYIVYTTVKGPSTKSWYNRFWYSLNRKEQARNAYSILLSFICVEFIFFFLYMINLDFKVRVFATLGSFILLTILFSFFIIPKRYTYEKIRLLEDRFSTKIKRWLAGILLFMILAFLIILPLLIVRSIT